MRRAVFPGHSHRVSDAYGTCVCLLAAAAAGSHPSHRAWMRVSSCHLKFSRLQLKSGDVDGTLEPAHYQCPDMQQSFVEVSALS
jgi:hypothetical protein